MWSQVFETLSSSQFLTLTASSSGTQIATEMLQPPIDASHRELSDGVSHDSVITHLPWAIAIRTTIRTFDFDFLAQQTCYEKTDFTTFPSSSQAFR